MDCYVPPYIDRLVAYVPGKPVEELERELGITNSVKLASNESPVGPSPHAIEAARKAAAEMHRYPDASVFKLRNELAAYHGVSPEEIAVGNGSNELIDILCRTFCGPEDHGVFGEPSFVCYRLGFTAANVPFTAVPLTDKLYWDVDAMLAAVTPKTRLLFVANPNNPTGTHMGGEALRRLLKEVPEHVFVVLDEAYVEFVDADDYVSAMELRELRERLIVLRTFSKAYGLAGQRVGYAIGPKEVAFNINRVRAPFNVNVVGQAAAVAALADKEHLARYVALNQKERVRVTEGLRGLGLDVAPSQANFVLANFGAPGREVYDKLLRKGVILRAMPAPIDTWLRVSVGLEEENERMLAAVAEWQRES